MDGNDMKKTSAQALTAIIALGLVGCFPGPGIPPKERVYALNPFGMLETGEASKVGGLITVVIYGNDSVTIGLRAAGLNKKGKHAVTVREGNCTNFGGTILTFRTLSTDISGFGSVDHSAPLKDLLKGDLAISVFQRDSENSAGIGTAIACGDIRIG